MKQSTKYLLLILLLLIVFFLGRGCKSNPSIPLVLINSDSIASLAYNKGYEIAKLESIGKVKDSIQTHYVTKWKVYREKAIHDTLLIECVTNCDSALNTQSDYICHLETINAHKDTAITYWRSAYRVDSTNVKTLQVVNDSLIKDRRKFWNGFKMGLGIGVLSGGVLVQGLSK